MADPEVDIPRRQMPGRYAGANIAMDTSAMSVP